MSRKTRVLMQRDANGVVIPRSDAFQSFRGDYTGTNLIYAGFARAGASEDELVWQIFKMSYDASNNMLDIKWPQNSSGAVSTDYEFSWTARAGYVYV